MSSLDIAEEIRTALPGTEEIVVQYLSGYLVDDAAEDEDMLQVARYMLESVAVGKPQAVDTLMERLVALLQDTLELREKKKTGQKLQRLEKVMDMSKAGAMSSTIAFAEGVDLESINKGKCVLFASKTCAVGVDGGVCKGIACGYEEVREAGGKAEGAIAGLVRPL
jgi:ATP-binding cassette, subfamily F, member 3